MSFHHFELFLNFRVAQAALLVVVLRSRASKTNMAVVARIVWGFSVKPHLLVLLRMLPPVVVGSRLLSFEGVLAVVAPKPVFYKAFLHLQALKVLFL